MNTKSRLSKNGAIKRGRGTAGKRRVRSKRIVRRVKSDFKTSAAPAKKVVRKKKALKRKTVSTNSVSVKPARSRQMHAKEEKKALTAQAKKIRKASRTDDKRIAGLLPAPSKKRLLPAKYQARPIVPIDTAAQGALNTAVLLKDIENYKNSKTLFNIREALAEFISKSTNTALSRYDKNTLKSAAALSLSVVLEKNADKPLKQNDTVELFIKTIKAIYKVILRFNERDNCFEAVKDSIEKTGARSNGYKNFLAAFPEIKKVHKRQVNPIKLLGKTVHVQIDRPINSRHPDKNMIYTLNYGFIRGLYANDGEELDAYVMGESRVVKTYKGKVIAIIQRLDGVEDKLVVAKKRYKKEEISKAVEFAEKYYQTQIII